MVICPTYSCSVLRNLSWKRLHMNQFQFQHKKLGSGKYEENIMNILEEKNMGLTGGRDLIEITFADGEKGNWFFNDNMTPQQKAFSICENLGRSIASVETIQVLREAEIDRQGSGFGYV